MRTVLLLVVLSLSLFFLSTVVVAAPPLETATLATPGTTRTLLLPPEADHSPVIALGSAVDPATGATVEGLAIIHRREANARGSGNGKPGQTCYGYLAKNAKWKVVEPWVVNTTNADGVDGATIFSLFTGGIAKWEDATDGDVTNGAGIDVLGVGSTTETPLVADTASPDGQNEVYFADISGSDTICVTIVWGIFGGPPSGRELVEWDQIYDDVTFDWSADAEGVADKMDLDNIATHELGHSIGMGDLYNTCVDETMYGYSDTAETKKRDLNSGDIVGANALY